ncbi:MAG: PDZ domain-containing protein [Longimicrobiales bacterium]
MLHRNIMLALLGAVTIFASDATAAQVSRRGPMQQRGWLGISYAADVMRISGDWRETLVVQEVVGGSPAQRAGVQAGDTLVAVNDIRATEQLMGSLGASLEPGDEVRLKVRRGGREQELRVEAGEVPREYAERLRLRQPRVGVYRIDPDTLSGRIRIYLDSARRRIDALPRFYSDTLRGGGWFFRDSALVMPWNDSIFMWRRPGHGAFTHVLPDSGARFFRDSTWYRFDPGFERFHFRMDSIIRFDMDSLRVSMRALGRPGWNIEIDTLFRGPGSYGIAILGSRAIAGAELTTLNADLGEYFGASRGVLVVRVPDGTPASDAGLEAGDVILSVNGRAVGSVDELRREIMRADTPNAVRLEVVRRNQRRTIELGRN